MIDADEAREAEARLADPVIWSDVENGAYAADLEFWVELAGAADGPILELGCGSGRVALHLARRGFAVTATDLDPRLVGAVKTRADVEGLGVEALVADVRNLDLCPRFKLVVAPMQLAHLIPSPPDRQRMLEAIARSLAPGGVAAFAVLDEEAADAANYAGEVELLPDMLERDGWVYSSLPTEVQPAPDGGLKVLRMRQAVSPTGELAQATWVERLARIDPSELERAAEAAGLNVEQRHPIPATIAHMGSQVVCVSAAA